MWRTTPLAGSGCSCGQPGAPGTPSGISARWLDVHSQLTDSPSWRYSFPQYYYPRTVLPLGATTGIDLRHVYPFPIIQGADSGLSLSQAADNGLYRLSWSGDATSLLVAFQMPTTRDGTTWDFSGRGGRLTPDLDELEIDGLEPPVLQPPPYGKYLQFTWSSVLKANSATDKIGTLDPLTLAGLAETPLCKNFAGQTVGRASTYGDVVPNYFHNTADTYGYFRQYDLGSCSSFLSLGGFVKQGLRGAATELTIPAKGFPNPVGDIHVYTTNVRLLLASVLLVPDVLVAAAAGAPAYREELQTQRVTSTLLLSDAPGPAGSCINNNLQYLDNSYCSVATDATLRALQRQPSTADFGRALARLVNSDRSMYTCGPIRGPGGYSGRLAALASTPNTTSAFGNTYLANRIGKCANPGDMPRLFVLGGQIVQACLDPNSLSAQCRKCAQNQVNGGNCDFWKLLASSENLGLLGRRSCLRPVQYHSSFAGDPVYPQVFCVSASGGRCLPRFDPYAGPLGSETAAMCVPVDPHCAPCWDLLDPGAAVHDTADLEACREAPAYCRVQRGQVNPQSCDARSLAFLFDQSLIRIPTPYRCRLELPLSRMELEPDGYRVVLANGFHCRSAGDCRPCPPGQPCNVDALGGDELKYLVWDQLTSVLGGGLGVPGDFDAPSCYPDRDELGGRPATGTSALLGQLENGKTLVNPAGCAWQ